MLHPRALQAAGVNISFFSVGPCAAVAAVKFDFADDDKDLCPESFRSSLTNWRCHVPGPYGREVHVALGRIVPYLDITLLDPSDDDKNLTSPTRIHLSAQFRNHIGSYLKPGTPDETCSSGFFLSQKRWKLA